MHNQLIGDQKALTRFGRVVRFVSDLVLRLLTIAVIASVAIYGWERFNPRVVFLLAPPAKKECGVPV